MGLDLIQSQTTGHSIPRQSLGRPYQFLMWSTLMGVALSAPIFFDINGLSVGCGYATMMWHRLTPGYPFRSNRRYGSEDGIRT